MGNVLETRAIFIPWRVSYVWCPHGYDIKVSFQYIYFKECNHKRVSSSYKNTINSNKNAILTEVAAFIKSMYVYNMNTYSAERNFIFSCVKFIMALFF